MDQSQRSPDGMVTPKNKAVARTAKNRPHTTTISLDSSRACVMKVAAVNCSPKVRVKFEVGTAPLIPHSAEKIFEVLLHFRMRAVQDVPRPTPPPAEGHQIRP